MVTPVGAVGRSPQNKCQHSRHPFHPRMARGIEIWPTDRLVPYAKNALTHSPEQVVYTPSSIVEFGFVSSPSSIPWIIVPDTVAS